MSTSQTSTTQSKSRTQRKAGRGQDAPWSDDSPTTPGEAMLYTDRCLKWLKTQMDHSYLPLPHHLTPYRHPLPTTNQPPRVVLEQSSYDSLPVHPEVGIRCTFCPQVTGPPHLTAWKNPYTRKSWIPMCFACAGQRIPSALER